MLTDEPKYTQISHFKHLNAMRFIAAFLVLVHHSEQIRLKEGLPTFKDLSWANFGYGAVVFFFVLSGFLITYLLLKERQKSHTISIKKFYQRRMARIWPLYFILVILGLWVVPLAINVIGYPYTMPYTTGESLPYFLFFMPFMVNILYGHSMLEPLWSIGVEELFYLWWAPAVKWLSRYMLSVLLTVICLKYLLLTLIHLDLITVGPIARQVITALMFEAMAIGGLAAWALFRAKRLIDRRWLFAPIVQWGVLAYVGATIFAQGWLSDHCVAADWLFRTPVVSQMLMIVAFAYLIVTLSVSGRSIVGQSENRVLSKLGEISYGIYMYHILVIFAVVLVVKPLMISLPAWSSTAVFYLLVVGLTISVSAISKRLIEDRFLKLKKY